MKYLSKSVRTSLLALGLLNFPAWAANPLLYSCTIARLDPQGNTVSTVVSVSDRNPANINLAGTNDTLNVRTYLGELIVELIDPALSSAVFSNTQPAGAWLEIRLGNPRLSVSCTAN